ncbi:MAG: hypothetical protein AB7F98_11790 [Novosphingobium sp.]
MSTGLIDKTRIGWTTDAFWRELCPALRIEDRDFISSLEQVADDEGQTQRLRDLIRNEGYFQLPPPEWQLPLEDMAALVAKLDAQGIPTAFAFVYDEFWALSVKLTRMLEGLLGPGFLRLPDFWCWHVDPARDESGWRPHRDKGHSSLRVDRSAKSLTVWLPLTESTTLNGCMYILPADRDPVYATVNDGQWQIDLPQIRALPAQPGTIFCWTQAVLHWGSHASPRESRPRISVAFEYQANDIPPYNEPLSPPLSTPVFDARLKLIAKQILQYQHMYPLRDDVKAIAQAML